MLSLKQRLEKQQQASIAAMLALSNINKCIGELITAIDNYDYVAQIASVGAMGSATVLVADKIDSYVKAAEEVIDGGGIFD